MDRRNLITLGSVAVTAPSLLTACGGAGMPTIPVDVKIDIPEELKDGIAAILKLDSLRNLLPASVMTFIDRGKELVAAITGAVSLDGMKSAGGSLVSLLGSLTQYLPKAGTIGTVVKAIETLLPMIAGSVGLGARMAARRPTGMSVAMARQVLRS